MHQPMGPPDEPADELRKFQGRPDSMRCHWCNRTKEDAVQGGRVLARLCPHCDVPEGVS